MSLKSINGLPVFDAKQSVKLTITKGDIARADPKEPADCAVARACRREMHVKEARVHLGRVYLRNNDGNWQRYMTPRALRTEIIAFDRGGGVRAGRIYAVGAAEIQAREWQEAGDHAEGAQQESWPQAAFAAHCH